MWMTSEIFGLIFSIWSHLSGNVFHSTLTCRVKYLVTVCRYAPSITRLRNYKVHAWTRICWIFRRNRRILVCISVTVPDASYCTTRGNRYAFLISGLKSLLDFLENWRCVAGFEIEKNENISWRSWRLMGISLEKSVIWEYVDVELIFSGRKCGVIQFPNVSNIFDFE